MGTLSAQQQVQLLEKVVALLEQQLQHDQQAASGGVGAPWKADGGPQPRRFGPSPLRQPGGGFSFSQFKEGLGLTGGGRILRGLGAGAFNMGSAATTAGGLAGGAVGVAASIGVQGAQFAASAGRIYADDTISHGEKNVRFMKFLGERLGGQFGGDIAEIIRFKSGLALEGRVDAATRGGVRGFIRQQAGLGNEVSQEELSKIADAYQQQKIREETSMKTFLEKTYKDKFLTSESTGKFEEGLKEATNNVRGFTEALKDAQDAIDRNRRNK